MPQWNDKLQLPHLLKAFFAHFALCMFQKSSTFARSCSTSTIKKNCEVFFLVHDSCCVCGFCCSQISYNCYTNVIFVHILEVIDLLLVNVQHLLQFLCGRLIFLCMALVVCMVFVVSGLCIIVAPMQLMCIFLESSTSCWQMFNIYYNFFV